MSDRPNRDRDNQSDTTDPIQPNASNPNQLDQAKVTRPERRTMLADGSGDDDGYRDVNARTRVSGGSSPFQLSHFRDLASGVNNVVMIGLRALGAGLISASIVVFFLGTTQWAVLGRTDISMPRGILIWAGIFAIGLFFIYFESTFQPESHS